MTHKLPREDKDWFRNFFLEKEAVGRSDPAAETRYIYLVPKSREENPSAEDNMAKIAAKSERRSLEMLFDINLKDLETITYESTEDLEKILKIPQESCYYNINLLGVEKITKKARSFKELQQHRQIKEDFESTARVLKTNAKSCVGMTVFCWSDLGLKNPKIHQEIVSQLENLRSVSKQKNKQNPQ